MRPKLYLDQYTKPFQQVDVSFHPNSRYFADQTGPFSIMRMNVTNSYKSKKKKKGKNGVICVVSMLSSWVVVLKMSKMDHFFKFLSCL